MFRNDVAENAPDWKGPIEMITQLTKTWFFLVGNVKKRSKKNIYL